MIVHFTRFHQLGIKNPYLNLPLYKNFSKVSKFSLLMYSYASKDPKTLYRHTLLPRAILVSESEIFNKRVRKSQDFSRGVTKTLGGRSSLSTHKKIKKKKRYVESSTPCPDYDVTVLSTLDNI